MKVIYDDGNGVTLSVDENSLKLHIQYQYEPFDEADTWFGIQEVVEIYTALRRWLRDKGVAA